MYTDTQVNDLIINILTEQQYEQIQQPSYTELYLVPETIDTTPTQDSTNPITSGAVYNALQGIPAVNDATLTIQKNGTTIDTFSANASQNKTINITVPSEITAQNPLSADLMTDGTTNKVFTSTEKTKLAGIEAGAEVNVQSDWDQTDTTADDYIKNKPSIPAAQVNADWNALNGVAQILNKPDSSKFLPAVTSTDNGKILIVANGAWSAAAVPVSDNILF